LMIYPTQAKYYKCSSVGDLNVFNLNSDDIIMLNMLMVYRKGFNIYTYDEQPYVMPFSQIDYVNDLSSTLSKLIYAYLDLRVNGKYYYFDNENLFVKSSGVKGLLETFFELFLYENLFTYVSNGNTEDI